MSRRAYLRLSLLTCVLTLPVLFGASCPAPSNPPFVSLNPGFSVIGSTLPTCEPGRLCISIVNQTCVDADVILYAHNGFDLTGEYAVESAYECCDNPNSTTACPCLRPGSIVGELQLQRPELFQASNRSSEIGGEIINVLPAGGALSVSFDCGDIKTFGLEVGAEGTLPGSVDERSGPHYRCTTIDVDREDQEAPEDVACGGTFQYTITDRNDCADPNLTVFRIETTVSDDCSSTVVETTDDDE